MPGIFGLFLEQQNPETFRDFITPSELLNEHKSEKYLVGRSCLDKLDKDRFIETKSGVTICFEGINLSDDINNKEDFFTDYENKGIDFVTELRGSYSGFIWDENKKEIFVFNDHLASRNIFYFFDPKLGFVFSSEMKSISKLLKELKIPFTLDEQAVYMMCLYGFIFRDHTYVNEIKKLNYSSILHYDYKNQELDVKQHFTYSAKKIDVSIDEAVNEVNRLFEKSVSKIWSKAANYGKDQLSFLSGGMDAKTNVLVAKSQGFDEITTITFGQSNSSDVKYAKDLAIKEELEHIQRYLDYPRYLVDNIMKNYIEPLDGLIMFHSSAHAVSTIKNINLDRFSILHTGQLGDFVLGSFTTPNFDFHRNRGNIGYTGKVIDESLLEKIEILPSVLDKYQELNFDIFNIEQRKINATMNGDRALHHFIDNISPFTDFDFINYCLSLPDKYRVNQIIYFHWLSKHHKNILEYPWERIGMKPNSSFKVNYGELYKKYFNGAKKYFNLKYDSMNPYAQWVKKHPFLLESLDNILEEGLSELPLEQELKKDLRQLYQNDVFEYRNKFAVATALLAIKLHFT